MFFLLLLNFRLLHSLCLIYCFLYCGFTTYQYWSLWCFPIAGCKFRSLAVFVINLSHKWHNLLFEILMSQTRRTMTVGFFFHVELEVCWYYERTIRMITLFCLELKIWRWWEKCH
jgi:hypothetical protein